MIRSHRTQQLLNYFDINDRRLREGSSGLDTRRAGSPDAQIGVRVQLYAHTIYCSMCTHKRDKRKLQ